MKQIYFERVISGWGERNENKFFDLLKEGWRIVIAIPIQSGMSCHTYTSEIHYVLEKED